MTRALLTTIFLCGCAVAPASTDAVTVEPYYDLGEHHRPITTASPEAQRWFDRGLMQCYGFNHGEAVRCFERALEADPGCAMAEWGIAHALGPNINDPAVDDADARRALEALARAAEQADAVTPVERALIAAEATRFTTPAPEDRTDLDRAYAEAMREVYRAHPGDPDVAAMFAEALMNLRPWSLFDAQGRPAPETPEIVAVLEQGLRRWPDHAGLCHFTIHTLEASPHPERALPAADRLRDLAPGAGHLVHMPSHIDIRLGRYPAAIAANQRAIAADAEFLRREGADNFYTLYRVHAYHFLAYGAMFDGQRQLALEAARGAVAQITDGVLREWIDVFDIFMATPLHVLIRFGMWEEVLAEPRPAPELTAATAVWRYARGVALANLGRQDEALEEQQEFQRVRAQVPESRILFNNTAADILGVADAMLGGEIAYRGGDPERAFALLREGVRLDDALRYDEPWGWMQPARHALGALLLDAGEVEEAERVYRADLERHPHNGWTLHGLAESLRRQGKDAQAEEVEQQFAQAWARADVQIPGSCFCR